MLTEVLSAAGTVRLKQMIQGSVANPWVGPSAGIVCAVGVLRGGRQRGENAGVCGHQERRGPEGVEVAPPFRGYGSLSGGVAIRVPVEIFRAAIP